MKPTSRASSTLLLVYAQTHSTLILSSLLTSDHFVQVTHKFCSTSVARSLMPGTKRFYLNMLLSACLLWSIWHLYPDSESQGSQGFCCYSFGCGSDWPTQCLPSAWWRTCHLYWCSFRTCQGRFRHWFEKLESPGTFKSPQWPRLSKSCSTSSVRNRIRYSPILTGVSLRPTFCCIFGSSSPAKPIATDLPFWT